MNEKALKTLEYYKITDMLTKKATSDPGRQMCSQLKPVTDLHQIILWQQQTKDALGRLLRKGSTERHSRL